MSVKLECFYCGHRVADHNDLFGCDEAWTSDDGDLVSCGCHLFPSQIEAVDTATEKDARIAELEAALDSIIDEADELNKVFGRRVPGSVNNAHALLKGGAS